MEDEELSPDSDVLVEEKPPELDEPAKYAVILHNDNYTTMDCVIEILERYFKKSKPEATAIMLQIHNNGSGAAGIYSLEIAETKAAQSMHHANSQGFPLKATVERVEGGDKQ